ncbi:hypothetical protein RCF68_09110, partial [Staphylococcus felis]
KNIAEERYMNTNMFQQKIEKQTWFLNKKEKKALHQYINSHTIEALQLKYKTPGAFVTDYLKSVLLNENKRKSNALLGTLIGLFVVNVILLGLFLTGLLISLSVIHYLIQSDIEMPLVKLIGLMVGSIVLIVCTLILLKISNRYFTKRLVMYKLNRAS